MKLGTASLNAKRIILEVFSTGFLNIVIRVLTMSARFLLVIYMGKRLSLEDLGGFGLISALVNLGIYFSGLELYLFTIRDLVGRPKYEWGGYLRDQMLVHAGMYVLAVIGSVCFVGYRHMNWVFFLLAPALLVIEHLCQEIYRLLEASGQATQGLLFLFLRSGAWVFIFIGLSEVVPTLRSLVTVTCLWLLGCILGILYSLNRMQSFGWAEGWASPVDWKRLKEGLRVSALYFVAALALRAIPMLDRLMIDRSHGQAAVGIYTFFFNLANGIQDFVNAGVIIVCYPAFLTAVRKGDFSIAWSWYLKLRVRIVSVAVLLIIGSSIFLWATQSVWISKFPRESFYIYFLLALGNGFQLFALIPYFRLYAMGHDRAVFFGALFFMILVVGIDWFLIPRFGAWGASAGFCLGSFGLFVLRYVQGRIIVPMAKFV